ncbi:MAG: hypothetical protein AB7L18_04720, partial [Hyphomicrobiaceae bacterium]
ATQKRATAFPGEDPATLPQPQDIAPLFVELATPRTEKTGETVSARAWLGQRNPAVAFAGTDGND